MCTPGKKVAPITLGGSEVTQPQLSPAQYPGTFRRDGPMVFTRRKKVLIRMFF